MLSIYLSNHPRWRAENGDDAALNLDSFLVSGDGDILTTDLRSLAGLMPGESKDFTAKMRTDTSGSFSVTTLLNFADK